LTIGVNIKDPNTGVLAKISNNGEILTRPLKFSEIKFASITVADTANNLYKPRVPERFVINGIILNTNKDVGVNGAIVNLYESSSATSLTIDTQLLRLNILKNDTVIIGNILVLTTEGKFINVKSDDTIVNISVTGFYIDV